jgi:hypothetical protein
MGDFEQLIQDIEAEARAEGPAAVAELAALEAHFRLAGELIARRGGLGRAENAPEDTHEGAPHDPVAPSANASAPPAGGLGAQSTGASAIACTCRRESLVR